MRSRRTYLAFAFVLCVALPGCDSDRLQQFSSFAAAGSAYVTAFHAFTQQAGIAFITADSDTLVAARNMAGDAAVASHAAEFRKDISTQNDQMKQYLENLHKLDHHADLLGNYFNSLANLTGGKAASSSVDAVNGLLDSVNQFNPEIEKVSFGGKTAKDLVAPVTNLVVAHFQARELDEELKKSAPVIQRALALQQAAVTALAMQMKASLGASLQVQEARDVVNPYVANAPLPDSWPASRLAFLQTSANLQSADSATAALTALQNAFNDLATKPDAHIDFHQLLNAIGSMAGYASSASAAAKK